MCRIKILVQTFQLVWLQSATQQPTHSSTCLNNNQRNRKRFTSTTTHIRWISLTLSTLLKKKKERKKDGLQLKGWKNQNAKLTGNQKIKTAATLGGANNSLRASSEWAALPLTLLEAVGSFFETSPPFPCFLGFKPS